MVQGIESASMNVAFGERMMKQLNQDILNEIIGRIVEVAQPEKIILFRRVRPPGAVLSAQVMK